MVGVGWEGTITLSGGLAIRDEFTYARSLPDVACILVIVISLP